jgi:hypothetical protein
MDAVKMMLKTNHLTLLYINFHTFGEHFPDYSGYTCDEKYIIHWIITA